MSPKIVDKIQRRKEIAFLCSNLIYEIGIKKLTVAQVAKCAGIGKGTIYEYFANKEDIIFELINIHIDNYHKEFLKKIENISSTKEKLFFCFKFVLDDSEENIKDFNAYKEYLSIVFSEKNDQMYDFNENTSIFFKKQLENMINEGINKGELKKIAKNLVEGIFVFEKGLVLLKMSQKNFNTKNICENFIDSLFDLILKKNYKKEKDV